MKGTEEKYEWQVVRYKGKIVSEATLTLPSLTIRVHHHIYHAPDMWVMSCHKLGIDLHELGNGSLEEASQEALSVARGIVLKLSRELLSVIHPLEEGKP